MIDQLNTFMINIWYVLLIVGLICAILLLFFKVRMNMMQSIISRLEKQVDERTLELKQRYSEHYKTHQETDKILKHVREGIFILNNKFEIGSQHSDALLSILDCKKISGKSFIDILHQRVDEEIMPSVMDFLELMFQDNINERMILDLNPLLNIQYYFKEDHESSDEAKFLSFKFRRIIYRNGTIELLGTVVDITEKVKLTENLEISAAEAKQQLEWLFNILHIDPMLIKDFITGVQMELDNIKEILTRNERTGNYQIVLDKIYQSIHMIKDNANLIDLDIFAKKAKQLEKKIKEIKDKKKIEGSDFIPLILALDEVKSTLSGIAGLIEKISKIHQNFRPKRTYESNMFVKSLKNYINVSIAELGKKVKLNEQRFDATKIPYEHRLLIKDILIQIIKDSIYYRIEKPVDRLRLQKNEQSTIEISTQINDNFYIIKIKDDGMGINTGKFQERALRAGICQISDFDQWDKKRYINAIYEIGFSSEKQSDIIGSRCIGMDMVKTKIENLKGKIDVDFEEGEFCEFTITMPLIRQNQVIEGINIEQNILN